MHKPLPPPPHLAACKPGQMSIPLVVTSGAAARLEAQLVDIPLAPPEPVPPSDKVEAGCFCASRQPAHPVATVAPTTAAAAASAPSSPSRSLLHKLLGMPIEEVCAPASPSGNGSAGPTPRIAALGGGGGGDRAALAAAPGSSSKEGLGYTQLSLHAARAAEPQPEALMAASAASASVSSLTDGSNGELSAAPSAASPDVFQIVVLRELSTTSTTACA